MSTSPPPSATSHPRELYRDDYITVRLEADGMLVRLCRSALPYKDIPSLLSSFEEVIATLDRLGRKGRVMLFDTRAPRGRNDPAFEQVMAPLRPRIDRGFVRIGVLVASAVGALQMRRWVSTDGIERLTSTDEPALVEALLANLPSRRS